MNTEEKESFSLARELYDIIEILVVAACIVLILYTFAARLCRVDGGSMDVTLADGQMLVVSNINYTPKYGDIIVFHQTSSGIGLNEPIVKRVIATGGQTIDIDFTTWTVTITDKDGTSRVLNEDSYRYLDCGYATRLSDWDYPLYVPEGYLFVMGDNRNNSSDSRSGWVGLVDERRVLGKALVRLTPLSKFGILKTDLGTETE